MSVVNISGKELQLLKKVRGSLELDNDVLHSVLTHPSIGDRPISIVSIAGAFRTGKSFMLNFFLRYLRNKGYENPKDWLESSSSLLKDGIQWRGGQQANTCGINIWSEPFIVKKGKKEIAVILLDTQGNADHADSKENDVKVFVISVLLSSTFIYNVSPRINNHDLEYLQFFMEFAKARKDSESRKASFQFLWFLIRDWECQDYSLGQEGGEEYLKSVLDTKDKSSLKKYLLQAFETINCYLMPNPGKKVRKAKSESSITLADIKLECREHISLFIDCLLNPESLVVKEIDGDVINGRWLAGYIARVWMGLKDGGLLSPDTMMELTAQAKYHEFFKKGAEKCREVIAEMHQSYLPDERIQEIEQQAMSAAFKLYDKNVKYGSEEIIKEYRWMLENTIKQQFKTLHITNDAYKVETEATLQDAVTTCLDNYENGVLERTHKKWTDKLELIHESFFCEAIKSFIVESAKISCKQLVNSYNDKLVIKLNQMYRRFKSDNERYENSIKSKLDEEENKIEKEFQEQCEKKLSADGKYVEEEELQKFFDFLKTKLINSSLEREKVATKAMKGMFRQAVEQRLKEKSEEVAKKNAENKFGYRLLLKSVVAKFRLSYMEHMEQKLNEAYIEPDALEKFHNEYVKDVLNELRGYSSNLIVYMEHEKEVKEMFSFQYNTVQKLNEQNEPLRNKVIGTVGAVGAVAAGAGGTMTGVAAITEIGVMAALSLTGIAVGGVFLGAGAGIYYGVSEAMKKSEQSRLKIEAAIQVSSGDIGSNSRTMGRNGCIIEVPTKAVKKGDKITLSLSTAFGSESWPKGRLAITPIFQCDPNTQFQKEIAINLPTWASTTSNDISVELMDTQNGQYKRDENQKEIKLRSVSDYVVKIKTSHFNDWCCFVKSSQIGLCSIRLSLHVFIREKADIFVVFHLADKTVQGVCEAAMIKSGLIPVFVEIEEIVVKYGESVNMSLILLNSIRLGGEKSMSFEIDEKFMRTGYIWEKFPLYVPPNIVDMELTYELNKKTNTIAFKISDSEMQDTV